VDVLQVLPLGHPMVGLVALWDLLEEILRVNVLENFPQYYSIGQFIGGSECLAQRKAVDPFQQNLGDHVFRRHAGDFDAFQRVKEL
jgi:glutaredoxin-related protein